MGLIRFVISIVIIVLIVINFIAMYLLYGYVASTWGGGSEERTIGVFSFDGMFNATASGQGIEKYVVCEDFGKAISGGCSGGGERVALSSFGLKQVNANLDYKDAWVCGFVATEPGEFYYSVSVNCEYGVEEYDK